MLTHLAVKNLAIVEEAAVSFGAGLNIITGETGAGKSVLMGALDLVLGGRADKSAIREGANEAWVDAVFELSDSRTIDALLDAGGLPSCEEGRLLIRRSVAATGAGRCLVNDASATVQTLRKLGCLLVDIHGPYDHQSLLDADFQRDILDAYGHCAPQLDAYAETWQTLKALEQHLQDLQGDTADLEAEIDRLRFVVDEISHAGLTEVDEADLLQQHAQAANAEQILSLGASVANALTDGEASAFDLLANIQIQLAELARILPAAAEWRTEVQSAAVQLQELGRAINDRLSQIDADPARLQQLEERMALVQRLKRKYGHTVAEILAALEKSRTRLDDLATRTEQVERLNAEIAAAAARLTERAAQLSTSRAKAAGKLARAITGELHDLGFLKAGFAIDLAAAAPGPHGADDVSFGFAPNPGEPMRPLKAIASSGEIARVMLAVKAVLAQPRQHSGAGVRRDRRQHRRRSRPRGRPETAPRGGEAPGRLHHPPAPGRRLRPPALRGVEGGRQGPHQDAHRSAGRREARGTKSPACWAARGSRASSRATPANCSPPRSEATSSANQFFGLSRDWTG